MLEQLFHLDGAKGADMVFQQIEEAHLNRTEVMFGGEGGETRGHRLSIHPHQGTQDLIEPGTGFGIEVGQHLDIDIGVLHQHQFAQFVQFLVGNRLTTTDLLQHPVAVKQGFQHALYLLAVEFEIH